MADSRPEPGKLSKLLHSSGAELLGLARAAVWLLAVDLGLRVVGFARVRSLLRWASRGGPSQQDPGDLSARWPEVEREARSVAVAARHHLYLMKCLTRSLVLQTLLARRGIASDLVIGVRKEGERFGAHAWVEWRGRPVAETESVGQRFATLTLPGL